MNRAHFGSVPNVEAAWWSSRDLRLPRSNSVLHPLSPESPHETTIPISLTRCLSPAAGMVRPSCPKISYPFPISPQTPASTPRKLQPLRTGYPKESIPFVGLVVESLETVDRDFGGRWIEATEMPLLGG